MSFNDLTHKNLVKWGKDLQGSNRLGSEASLALFAAKSHIPRRLYAKNVLF